MNTAQASTRLGLTGRHSSPNQLFLTGTSAASHSGPQLIYRLQKLFIFDQITETDSISC